MGEAFFKPRSVVVVGASEDPRKVGYAVARNLLDPPFPGDLYFVNPKRDTILGKPVYHGLRDLPQNPDLAVLVVPPRACIQALDELGAMGTRRAVVISAGFKESGVQGASLEEALVEVARRHGVRLVGPNCLGVIDTHTPLNASFAPLMPPRGSIAFLSQSGALLTALLDWAGEEGMGFSKLVSLGNRADVTEAFFLDYLEKDPETRVILMYIEGLMDGRRFIEVARRVNLTKPILVVKSGRTQSGARAVSSHTGSIAGRDQAYEAAFREAGVVRVGSVAQLFYGAAVFATQPLPRGKRVAVLTNAGGPAIMASDAVDVSFLEIARFTKRTVETLRKVLPPMANVYNPVDVIGDAGAQRYANALDALLADPHVDAVLVILTPQMMTEVEDTARVLVERAGVKPMVASFMGGREVEKGVEVLKGGGIPHYPFPEDGVEALALMARYREGLEVEKEHPPALSRDVDRARVLVEEWRSQGVETLDEFPARELLKCYGIPVPRAFLATTPQEAVAAARELGFPVVLKLSSPHILHKSDVGGVKVGLSSPQEVEGAFYEITLRARKHFPRAHIRGVLVEEGVSRGVDVIVGFTRDATFGPLMMFGLGGIYVEILKDVTFRLAPLTSREGLEMIREVRSYPVLRGARGGEKVDEDALGEVLVRFSLLAWELDLAEGEANPLRAMSGGVMALDARFALGGKR